MKTSSLSFLISGGTLATAVMAANVINLLFNAYLGRVVSAEEFGTIALINTFMYFGSLFYNAIGGITNREVAFLDDGEKSMEGTNFYLSLSRQLLFVNSVLAIVWLLAVPFTANFFHLNDRLILYLLTPLFILYPLAFLGRGYLQGKLLFALAGITVVIEPLIKFLSAFLLFNTSAPQLVYLSIYISAAITGVVTFFIAWKKKTKTSKFKSVPFPFTFFGAALLSGISSISFLALDMILVKHFLSPEVAGQYAFLSLIGKIIFFAGSLLNVFTISLVSRQTLKIKNPFVSFYSLLLGSTIMAFSGVVVFGILGYISIPLFLTQKANPIIPFATSYLSAIALFTLGNTIVTYHLAFKQYFFSVISFVMSLGIIFGIIYFHASILQIVNLLLTISLIYITVLVIAHIRQKFFVPKIRLSPLENITEDIL